MMTRTERIKAVLAEHFAPVRFELRDDSAKHASHMTRMDQPKVAQQMGLAQQVGHAPQVGETHYHLAMVSARFAGMGRVARSRAVHEALDGEFKSGLHALALELKAPGEA